MGGGAGATLGYIVGNVPGAVAGGFAGNRLGAVRDAKGKSVAQVFSGMESSKKAEVGMPGSFNARADDRSCALSLSKSSAVWARDSV